jgi:hypothetical protein
VGPPDGLGRGLAQPRPPLGRRHQVREQDRGGGPASPSRCRHRAIVCAGRPITMAGGRRGPRPGAGA